MMIDGVKTKLLRVIPDERGRVMEILRADDDLFLKFGQVYVTTTYPQVVKAWHYHKIQTDHIVAVQRDDQTGPLRSPRRVSDKRGDQRILHRDSQSLAGSSAQGDLPWVEMHQ